VNRRRKLARSRRHITAVGSHDYLGRRNSARRFSIKRGDVRGPCRPKLALRSTTPRAAPPLALRAAPSHLARHRFSRSGPPHLARPASRAPVDHTSRSATRIRHGGTIASVRHPRDCPALETQNRSPQNYFATTRDRPGTHQRLIRSPPIADNPGPARPSPLTLPRSHGPLTRPRSHGPAHTTTFKPCFAKV
jgi:hypothetical protein